MIHRQNQVFIAGPTFAASYTVLACPVGARAGAASSGTTATVDAGHGFVAGDKALIWDGTTATFVAEATSSVTGTTIVWASATPTIAKGDLLVNLGPDAASGSTPNYTASPMKLFTDFDGTDAITNAEVTTDTMGNYEYNFHGDGRSWELIRDAAGVVAGVVPGWGGQETRYNVCDFGARRDGAGDTLSRVQAAIDASSAIGTTTGATSGLGGTVWFPIGTYLLNGPIMLPRWLQSTHPRGIRLRGESKASTILQGNTGFVATQGVIMWEATAFRVDECFIEDLLIIAPSIDKTHCISFIPTLTSTWAELNIEPITLQLRNIELHGENEFHQSLVRIVGISRNSRFIKVNGDPIITNRVYDTMMFEFDQNPISHVEANAFDEPGCNWGRFEHTWAVPNRGGWCGIFKGRAMTTKFVNTEVGTGNHTDPVIDLYNSVGVTFDHISTEGAGEQPQIRLTDCRYIHFPSLLLGHPNQPAGKASVWAGNGIELIASTNCFIERVGDDQGFTSWNGVDDGSLKLITLDANSHRNHIIMSNNPDIDTAFVPTEEFTDSGNDNIITMISETDSREFYRGGPRCADVKLFDDVQGFAHIRSKSEEITLASGVASHDSTTGLLPADSLILGIAARCSITPGSAAPPLTYTIGDDSPDTTRFQATLNNATDGITVRGLDHWTGGDMIQDTGASNEIRITTLAANPTDSAGRMQITVYYILFQSPQSDR